MTGRFRLSECTRETEVTSTPQESARRSTYTTPGEDGDAQTSAEMGHHPGETVDNENNVGYLSQGEVGPSMSREMSALPLLELTPMTGNRNRLLNFISIV